MSLINDPHSPRHLDSKAAGQNSALLHTFKGHSNFKWMPLEEARYKFLKVVIALISNISIRAEFWLEYMSFAHFL